MANIPHSYYIEVYFNENGIPDGSEIINNMVRIAKIDNPIIDKNNGAEPIIKVGDLIDIKEKKDGEDQTNKTNKAEQIS